MAWPSSSPTGSMRATRKAARSIGTATQGTAHAAGLFAGIAEAFGLAVVEIPAGVWRQRLCGRGEGGGKRWGSTATDAVVKRAIETYVIGWPKVSNAHARDAAGVGVVAFEEMRRIAARRTGT
jgi:hypothetical protein